MKDDPMIAVNGLKKSYNGREVLSGVGFNVDAGEIYALLGPNGAGKTTTVNILTTLASADSGTVTVAGFDVRSRAAEVRRSVSLTGQYAAVDEFQTGAENLMMMSRLAHLGRRARERTRELLAQFDLLEPANRPVSSYSGGMRRRLDLAISLISRPPVIVLDEPTTGLDPTSRVQLFDVVRSLAHEGVTILLTTQYLEEADQLADRIAVLGTEPGFGGRIVAEGTADELKRDVSGERVELSFGTQGDFEQARLTLASRVLPDVDRLTLSAVSTDSAGTIKDLLTLLGHVEITGIAIIKPTLDDVFFALTGHPMANPADGRQEEAA